MSKILSFVSPLEYLLRYTVICGVIVAVIGLVICLLAKHITQVRRKTDQIDKNDRLYLTLFITGICLILVGMIFMVLPISDTFYNM